MSSSEDLELAKIRQKAEEAKREIDATDRELQNLDSKKKEKEAEEQASIPGLSV